ncbi:MAG: NUDIX hydrolase [Bacillota bacterium]|nr:NUDIX hydrolase [Bacillota bacterium]
MFLTAEKLAPLIARYGQPRLVDVTQAVSTAEMDMVLDSRKDGRAHDVTCFILDGRGQVAVIRKHFHPPGVWRAPSGGIRLHEDVEHGIRREMREETGLDIRLERYLLRISVTFFEEGSRRREQAWTSHVFAARPEPRWAEPRCAGGAGAPLEPPGASLEPPSASLEPPSASLEPPGASLEPEDRDEIASARWATIGELQGPIHRALLATGRGLFRYRVALTDLAVAELRKMGWPQAVV